MPLSDDAHTHAARRRDRVVTRVELEPRARLDLTEVPRAVRTCRGEHRAGIARGVSVLDRRSHGEPQARRERYRHARRDEHLPLAHPIHAVGLRTVGVVAYSVEPNQLETRRAQLDVENRRQERPPELTCHVDAVPAGAGRVGGLRQQARARRQRAESVPGVQNSRTDQQSEIRGVTHAEERHRLGLPGVRAALPRDIASDEGESREELYSAGQPRHEPEHPAAASRQQGLAHTIHAR